jgi:hypothetical protein
MIVKKPVDQNTAPAALSAEDRLRVVVDYRDVNELVVVDSQPMPIVDEVVEAATPGYLFSKLDIKSAFFQLPLSDDSKEITAFAFPWV